MELGFKGLEKLEVLFLVLGVEEKFYLLGEGLSGVLLEGVGGVVVA